MFCLTIQYIKYGTKTVWGNRRGKKDTTTTKMLEHNNNKIFMYVIINNFHIQNGNNKNKTITCVLYITH